MANPLWMVPSLEQPGRVRMAVTPEHALSQGKCRTTASSGSAKTSNLLPYSECQA